MLLTEVECEGYKAFSASTRMAMRRLTVIFGRNNSGKTTLARLPLFAAASLSDLEHNYALSVGGIRFGSSFSDLASSDQPHPKLSFMLAWHQQSTPSGDPGDPRSLDIELQYVTTGVERHSVQPRRLAMDGGSPKTYELTKTAGDTSRRSLFFGLEPNERDLLVKRSSELRLLVRDTIHIPSGRAKIESTYATREPNAWTVDEVPYLLASNSRLASEVASWYFNNLNGMAIDVDLAAFAFRMVEVRNSVAVSLSESGRGTQAVLPVVALLLGVALREQRARLLVIEEPEEHLHPSAHGAVGDLLIAASRRSQVVVETHSENLILRLRRRIALKELNVNDIAFYYVDDDHRVIPISIDRFGVAENWPSGIFEGDAEEAQDIVEAKLAAMGSFGANE